MAFSIGWLLDKLGEKIYAWSTTNAVMDFDRGGEEGQTLQKTLNDIEQKLKKSTNSIIFASQLSNSNWTEEDDGSYSQTVSCPGIVSDIVCAPPLIEMTGNKETDLQRRVALSYIDEIEILEGQIKVVCYSLKPQIDLIIKLVPVQGSILPPVGMGTVRSVNGIEPDGVGNVNIIADVPTV